MGTNENIAQNQRDGKPLASSIPGIFDAVPGEATLGTHKRATKWSFRVPFRSLLPKLIESPAGQKDGACYTPAIFRGTRRIKTDADQIGVVVLDSDCGHELHEIVTAIEAAGYEALIHSTHSHLTTQTEISCKDFKKFDGSVPDYMLRKKSFLPRIIPNARIVSTDESGKLHTVEHEPCPKFRILIPLAQPWRADAFETQDIASLAWHNFTHALATSLGLSTDQSCCDTSRFFYLPRTRENGPQFKYWYVKGLPCDMQEVLSAAPNEGPRPNSRESDFEDEELVAWAANYGSKFEIVTALRARKPEVIVRPNGAKTAIQCPFESEHTEPGGEGCVAVNASDMPNAGLPSVKSGFFVKCMHNACVDRDRLVFVAEMLRQGWLTDDDLTAPEFLAGGENAGNKIRLRAPAYDAEVGPVLESWDEILSAVDSPEPPMRGIDGAPVEVQCRDTVGLHELAADSANDEDDEKSRLPAPKHHLLTKHDSMSLELLIGDHITFIKKKRVVAPPDKFIRHYAAYRRSKLPRVHAALTMPLVLPNGTLLASNGLDRDRRAVFRIEPELLQFIPRQEDCFGGAVHEAFKFLADDWLCDVATGLEGKCVLIALALTIIERILLSARPLFFITAGLRGGGKTTTLSMVALAATGVKVSASAWSPDPNERKKALFSYLLEALPFLVWDNIPRGTMIACPHLERASTTETYSDRVLGETKTLVAPAYTIHGFTGNNIGPKSDQASRSLEVRLSTDRPDPENRDFKHQDPITWTCDHRGQILEALYTILLGNPRLKPEGRGPAETRFKEWWHLVGAAVEHAAGDTAGRLLQPISFRQMFERTESKDEDAAERANVILALRGIYGEGGKKNADGRYLAEFTSTGVHKRLEDSAREAEKIGAAEDPVIAELRRFCTAPKARSPSTTSVSLKLQTIVDAPIVVEVEGVAKTLCLETLFDSHAKQRSFVVLASPCAEH